METYVRSCRPPITSKRRDSGRRGSRGTLENAETFAYRDKAKVSAVLANVETAPIDEPLRATLRVLRKLTREHTVSPDDMRTALAAGASRQQIEDALAVCFTFNTVDRLSRTFGFVVSSSRALDAGARFLLSRGYYS